MQDNDRTSKGSANRENLIYSSWLRDHITLSKGVQPLPPHRATAHQTIPTSLTQPAIGTQTAKLIHMVHKPAWIVHLKPGLQHSSLFSISKFADANYTTIFTPQAIKNFGGDMAKISSTGEPTLKGWRDPTSGLWEIPLLLPNQTKPHRKQQTSPTQNNQQQISSINSVHELPSIERVIKYHHATAWYPTKTM